MNRRLRQWHSALFGSRVSTHVIMQNIRMNTQSIILTKIYISSLILLLLNDILLKQLFPGFITGKLSDFTGLFIFVVFWIYLILLWLP